MKLHRILNLIHSLIYYCDLHERHLIPLELVEVWLCSLLKRDEESVFPRFFFFTFFFLAEDTNPSPCILFTFSLFVEFLGFQGNARQESSSHLQAYSHKEVLLQL